MSFPSFGVNTEIAKCQLFGCRFFRDHRAVHIPNSWTPDKPAVPISNLRPNLEAFFAHDAKCVLESSVS